MIVRNRMCRWMSAALFSLPLMVHASMPVKSMVVFGDSFSDYGNTTHLLKSLRQEESPAFLVAPFKAFVLNKMIDFANDFYVPQMVLDSGISVVTQFFDYELAPYIANLVAKVRLVPVLPGKPYWNNHFSNGLVWNEYLAKAWAIDTTDDEQYINKAFAGSWASTYDYELTTWNLIRHPIETIKTLIVGKLVPPSFGLIVQAHLLEHDTVDNEAVHLVFYGSNDYFNVLFYEDKYNPEVMSRYIDNVVAGVEYGLVKLLNQGARRFVVLSVPHVGDMPKHVKTADREVLNAAVDKHNERLAIRIEALKKLHPDADFLFVDSAKRLDAAVAQPQNFGFAHVKDACIDVEYPMFSGLSASPYAQNYALHYAQVLQYKDASFGKGQTNYRVCDKPESYVYWDDFHLTTRAHAVLAQEVCDAMQTHGYDVACETIK